MCAFHLPNHFRGDTIPPMDVLRDLNPQQQQAVMAGSGPVLVLAGPGSGKTRVLTQRIAYLIGQMGVRPYHILAVTFTNKAAREMGDRVEAMLGERGRGLTLGTFHAACGRILRREADHLPFDSNYVIFDAEDQERVVKQVIKDLNLDDKLYAPHSIHATISRAKNELIFPDDFPVQTYRGEVVKRVYQRYQQTLLSSNALDFDDMLLWTAFLLEEKPVVRERYARRYEHVLVDEFQDTNMAQYVLLKHLSSFHQNIFVVGDPDQCFSAGTLIQTPQGQTPIENLQIGDLVIAASGRGSILAAKVNHIGKRHFDGSLVRVQTKSGATFRATPNHIVFARLGLQSGLHYVYLMYRKDKGYRVGVASHTRSDGVQSDMQMGLKVRSNQENADKVWVLGVCSTREEAYYWESWYAFKYGIPTTVFHVRGRRMRMTQDQIDRLFQEIDTTANAWRLFADLELDFCYPHYIPQGTSRNAVNLRYFGDGRRTAQSPWHAHRVDLWSSDVELAKKLRTMGYNPRIRSRNNWRVGLNRLHYDEIQQAAHKLSAATGGAEIVTGAFLTPRGASPLAPRFSLLPVSHLHITMIVAIEKEGAIIEDEIIEVSREDYHGDVYDFEVDNLHNYIAGGVVVHNSVYRWRGADYRNMRRFEQDFPDARVILLEQNYRSTQTILDTAMAVIDRNPQRMKKALFTGRGQGQKICLRELYDDREVASFVVESIADTIASDHAQPGDFAVMYRTNAQSRILEETFLAANLPYKLVGAQRFYGRREIKDILAYLRLTYNPKDEVSMLRVINAPRRGIGVKTIADLRTYAQSKNISPGEVLLELGVGAESGHWDSLPNRVRTTLFPFGKLLSGWCALREQLSPPELMDRIIEDVAYRSYIDEGGEEGAERWENVMEFRRLAADYRDSSLATFLEDVALVSDQDTIDAGANVPTLMTLHTAKGLEFPIVFIVGLNDGTLPHIRSFEDPEAMEEERRLLYVGITRAKDRLYLLHSLNRNNYGYSEPTKPSRYLGDIPMSLIDDGYPEGMPRYSRPSTFRPERWESPASTVRIVEQEYATGMRVNHPAWGEGMVLNSKIEDGEEIVDVFFEDVGLKRVVASLAGLTILS